MRFFAHVAMVVTGFLLLAVSFAAPAHAQNNMPIRSGVFYEDRASSTSNGVVNLTFAQSPTDKFLNITNVACDIQLGANQALAYVEFNVGTTSGNPDLGRNYPLRGIVTPEIASNGAKYYSIVTNQIYYKMGPGRFPSIAVTSASTQTAYANCIIVGNLSDN